jgi:hypothetical protein
VREEVKKAIAHVIRGKIQHLEERERRYEDEQALDARLFLLREGLRSLEYKLVLEGEGSISMDIGAP